MLQQEVDGQAEYISFDTIKNRFSAK